MGEDSDFDYKKQYKKIKRDIRSCALLDSFGVPDKAFSLGQKTSIILHTEFIGNAIEKIKKNSQEINGLKEENSDVKNRLKTLESNVGGLESNVGGLKTMVESLEDKNTVLSNSINLLQQKEKSMKETVDSLSEELVHYRLQARNHEQTIASQGISIQNLTTKVVQHQKNFQNDVMKKLEKCITHKNTGKEKYSYKLVNPDGTILDSSLDDLKNVLQLAENEINQKIKSEELVYGYKIIKI